MQALGSECLGEVVEEHVLLWVRGYGRRRKVAGTVRDLEL
jgi:hypothetical protein